MSNDKLIIEERSRDIGDFMVGRLLPFRKKRMIGPYIFVDHMGPTDLGKDRQMEVDQHPHIGLATLTYLLSGEIMHADSIGSLERIRPGEVNLMIAGKAVTHTERTPHDLVGKPQKMEGYQIWLALPKEIEDMEPEFHHLSDTETEQWEEDGLQYRLVVGKAFGKKSKLQLWSDLFMVEINAKEDKDIDFGATLKGEIGIIINQGTIEIDSEKIGKGNLLASKQEDICKFRIEAGSKVFILGGQPFPEGRFIDWNFVSSDKAKIEKAKEQWDNKQFPKVANDDTYVPYPHRK